MSPAPAPRNSARPSRHSPITHPAAHTSLACAFPGAFSQTPRGRNCSGARYHRVPTYVSRSETSSPDSALVSAASPKSARRTAPSAMRMFSGLTSRCAHPCAWQCASARSKPRPTPATELSGNPISPRALAASSVLSTSLSHHSVTRNTWPRSRATCTGRSTLGCLGMARSDLNSAVVSKSWPVAGSVAAFRCFTAYSFRARSPDAFGGASTRRAAHTVANAPSPSFFSSSNSSRIIGKVGDSRRDPGRGPGARRHARSPLRFSVSLL